MNDILTLIVQMSPYILLGFLLAGIMHAFIPQGMYRKYLGGTSFRSVFNAALLGVPLPLCSCGVIPTAMSLRKEGASKGATTSFLISTPQTGVDSIIATYSLMGLPFALIRPVVALITALAGGMLVNRISKNDMPGDSEDTSEGLPKSCKTDVKVTAKIKTAFRYAFVEMMQDIGRWLVLGLIIAGVITVLVPDSFFAVFAGKPLLSMMLVLIFAIPMYLCATGSIPIAVALMLKGLSPGTALVLLMAGPAVNVASILVVGKLMGRKTLAVYLFSIIAGAIVFGLGIDYLLPRDWFTAPLMALHACPHETLSWFNMLCAVALFVLLVNALVLRYTKNHKIMTEKESNIVITVKGMSCNHCRSSVEKAIMAVDGVQSVDVDLLSGKTVITGHVNETVVTKVVEELGFTVS